MAKGSHATLAGWEPRTCGVCGERVTLSGRHARRAIFRHGLSSGRPSSRHADCVPRVTSELSGATKGAAWNTITVLNALPSAWSA
jgi:hypothetical protein